MPVPARADIAFELLELCEALLVNIEQQLLYYRASVYKEETARNVEAGVVRLQNILEMFNDNTLLEPLADYRALQLHDLKLTPGECSFSRKVSLLVVAARGQLRLYRRAMPPDVDLRSQIQHKRQQVLSLCRQGSRQWSFFRSL